MIVAMFPDERRLAEALKRFQHEDLGELHTHTPAPMQDADTSSPIPLIILGAALLTCLASFGLQAYSATLGYPFDIGGRPAISWPSFVPTMFENAVLVSMSAGFAAYMIINRMPRLYEPIDEIDGFREASRDGWFLVVRLTRSQDEPRAMALLDELRPARIDRVINPAAAA